MDGLDKNLSPIDNAQNSRERVDLCIDCSVASTAMQLSDVEKKMVARLRKRKQVFTRMRWMLLFIGIFCIGVGIFCFVILLRCLRLDPAVTATFSNIAKVSIAALYSPIAFLFVLGGAYILTDTLAHWQGRPEVDLLLRLIEDSQDDD